MPQINSYPRGVGLHMHFYLLTPIVGDHCKREKTQKEQTYARRVS